MEDDSKYIKFNIFFSYFKYINIKEYILYMFIISNIF